jgi:hypothetical protein
VLDGKQVPVSIARERVQYHDGNGKLITESLRDYTRINLRKRYESLDAFLQAWSAADRKAVLLAELDAHGSQDQTPSGAPRTAAPGITSSIAVARSTSYLGRVGGTPALEPVPRLCDTPRQARVLQASEQCDPVGGAKGGLEQGEGGCQCADRTLDA